MVVAASILSVELSTMVFVVALINCALLQLSKLPIDEESSIIMRFTSRSGLSKLLLIVSRDTDCSLLFSLSVRVALFSRFTSTEGGVDAKNIFSCFD